MMELTGGRRLLRMGLMMLVLMLPAGIHAEGEFHRVGFTGVGD